MDVESLRLFERLVIALGGILSIWLGYKLFSVAEIKAESSGSFKSSVANITMTKVGPGVFFALFGAFVLYTGITTTIRTENRRADQVATVAAIGSENNIQLLQSEIGKLPDGEIKKHLVELVSKLQNDSRRFMGELYRNDPLSQQYPVMTVTPPNGGVPNT
jgi:hypothetical protein